MLVVSLFVHIQHCLQRYQTRKALAKLTLAQLKDVGISQEVRTTETAKATLGGFYHDLWENRTEEANDVK